MEFEAAIERIQTQSRVVGALAGTKDIKKLLSKARRAFKGKTPNPEKAMDFLAQALAAFDENLAWRKRAVVELAGGFAAYDEAIRDTNGDTSVLLRAYLVLDG